VDLLVAQAFRSTPSRYALGVVLVLLCQVGPASGVDLSILETIELDFGAVLDSNGAVVLGLGDAITADPAGIHVGSIATTGEYMITGDPFAVFSLSILGSSASGLTINDFETSEGTPPLLSVVLNGAGEIDIRMGATLTVDEGLAEPGIDQPLTYTISINYN
jgi:hypothetical protein